MTAYDEAIAYLLSLEVVRGWDLELGRMRAMLARRGNPERRFAAIHVAGTNGKGSTAALIERVLRAAGQRTGLYTSPHLIDFTERARAGGAAIPRATVVELVRSLRADSERAGIPLTHFEFATVLAFEWFAAIGVEVAVIEVGLGGRLDATNVLTPIASVITSIDYDHQAFLGDSLASIAGEKAGVVKPAVPVVIGPGLPAEAEAVIRARALALGAPAVEAGAFDLSAAGWRFAGAGATWNGPTLGLPGAFQNANAATALTVLAVVAARFRCTPAAVRAGVARVEWPGRLSVVQHDPLVIFDGAHNPAGAAALAGELPSLLRGTRAVLVFAVMADKAWPEMLARLSPFADRIVLTQVGRRGLDPAAIRARLADDPRPVEIEADPERAVRTAVERAGREGAVLVAGSLFLIGAAYSALRGPDARLFPEWQGWEAFGTEPPA